MTASNSMRSVEDLSMGALSYAEIKAIASGNPLVLEKATVDAQVMKYSMLRDVWEQDRWVLSARARSNADIVRGLQATIAAVEQDTAVLLKEIASGLKFTPSGSSMGCESANSLQSQIGVRIYEVSRNNLRSMGESLVGIVGGMQVILNRYDGLQLSLRSSNDNRIHYAIRRGGVPIHDAFGTGKLVTDMVESLVDEPAVRNARMLRLSADCEQISSSADKPFEHEAKFAELVLRQRAIESELDLDKDEAGIVEAPEAVTS